MKKYTLISSCILVASLLASACSNQSIASNTDVKSDSPQKVVAFSSETMPQAYKSVINKYECLINGVFELDKINDDDELFRVATSFRDAIKNGRIGYVLCDLNYDGSPELLIGEMLTPKAKDRVIIDAYMLRGGQSVQIFSSTDRDRYYYIDDQENERILLANEWSNGANYSGRTYFRFTHDKQLKCIDSITYKDEQWYECTLDGSNLANIAQANPIKESFALDIIHNYENMYTALNFTKLKAKPKCASTQKQVAAPGVPKLQAQYAEDVLSNFSSYTKFKADQNGTLSKIVFSVNCPVKDLKFLNVELIDVDDNGKANFSSQEIYSQNVLEPQKPLVVEMNLPETVPTHGISYTDGNGQTKKFIIGLSGQDGSIFLTEF